MACLEHRAALFPCSRVYSFMVRLRGRYFGSLFFPVFHPFSNSCSIATRGTQVRAHPNVMNSLRTHEEVGNDVHLFLAFRGASTGVVASKWIVELFVKFLWALCRGLIRMNRNFAVVIDTRQFQILIHWIVLLYECCLNKMFV